MNKRFTKRFPRGGKSQAKLVFNHVVKAIYHVRNYSDLTGEALRDACYDLALKGSGDRIVYDYEVNGQKPSNRTGVLLHSKFVAIFESAWTRAEESYDPYFLARAAAGGRKSSSRRPAIFSYKHLKGLTQFTRSEQAQKLGCSDGTIGRLRREYRDMMARIKAFFPEVPSEMLEEVIFAGDIEGVAKTGKKASMLRNLWKVKRKKTNKYSKWVRTTPEQQERVDSYNARTIREQGYILGVTHILNAVGDLVALVRKPIPNLMV